MKVKKLIEELKKQNQDDLVIFMSDKRNCMHSGIKSVESGYKFHEGDVYNEHTDDVDGIKDKCRNCVYLKADESV